MTRDAVRIGIVGIGNMGANHVRHVIDLPNTELAAVCDRDMERVKTAFTREVDAEKEDSSPDYARIVADSAQFSDYRAMLDAADLDAVLIATPHYDHPDMSLLAFERGLHVLVEKPIAVHVKEAERMIAGYEAAKARCPKLVFAAMFMQRAWGHWRVIKSMVESGELGQLLRCSWIITDWFRTQRYYDSGGWRATWSGEGGGALMNQCPHNLDLYQWIVGMPRRVQGFVSFGKHHRIEVEDEATAYFEHDGGMIGHFITSTGESPGSNILEIAAENGKLVYRDGVLEFYRNEWSSIKQIRESDDGFKAAPYKREPVDFEAKTSHGHEIIIANFADAVLKGTELIAPAAEGLNSVAINNAIILSAHKRRMVELPLDADEYQALLEQYIAEPPA